MERIVLKVEPSFQSPEQQPLYILRIQDKGNRLKWNVKCSFSEIRDFRNAVMSIIQKDESSSCPMLSVSRLKTEQLKEVLEFGFPQRRMFKSTTLAVMETRAEKMNHCLSYLLHFHKNCPQGSNCDVGSRLKKILQLANTITRSVSASSPTSSSTRYGRSSDDRPQQPSSLSQREACQSPTMEKIPIKLLKAMTLKDSPVNRNVVYRSRHSVQ